VTVLADTAVWSLFFRRLEAHLSPGEQAIRNELAELIQEQRAQLIGPVRQEVLAGLREEAHFHRLRHSLRAFPDPAITIEDYELAAEYYNRCRASGIVGNATDLLICAVAARRDWQVFTTDRDFIGYARHLPIALYKLRAPAN
jgi:predicted nucleic acid-binding protein